MGDKATHGSFSNFTATVLVPAVFSHTADNTMAATLSWPGGVAVKMGWDGPMTVADQDGPVRQTVRLSDCLLLGFFQSACSRGSNIVLDCARSDQSSVMQSLGKSEMDCVGSLGRGAAGESHAVRTPRGSAHTIVARLSLSLSPLVAGSRDRKQQDT